MHSTELRKKLVAVRHSLLSYRDWLGLLKSSDLLIEAASHKFNFNFPTKILSFNIVSEQMNMVSRRIQIDNNQLKLYWDFNARERESVRKFCATLVDAFPGEVQNVIISSAKSIPFTACAHHSGTMRMSSSSLTGVVDSNLKMFGFNNTYVCDGSVLPRTGYANTGLTIASLAIRLARHLKAL
jgi:choline dehydrogenase-like flavoprotein